MVIDCPHVQEVADEVINCGANKFAAMEAQLCSDQVIDSWNTAAENLKPLLLRDAGNKQDTSQTNTRADYDKALAALDAEIALMQRYTDLIAAYPSAGIDFPEGESDETSAPCFNDAFHKIQDIVTNLDKQIIQAKRVRKLAAGLRGNSDQFHQNLAASLNDALAKGALVGKKGANTNGASDVTGLAEARAKARAVEAAGKGSKIGAPVAGAGAGGASTVTSGGPRRHAETASRMAEAATQSFGGVNSLKEQKYDPKARTAESAGEAIFSKTVDGSDKPDLAVGTGASPGGVVGAGTSAVTGAATSAATGAQSSNPELSGSALLEANSEISATLHGSDLQILVASPDVDIFARLHERYRTTDLFKSAHVSTVPLNGFESTFKK